MTKLLAFAAGPLLGSLSAARCQFLGCPAVLGARPGWRAIGDASATPRALPRHPLRMPSTMQTNGSGEEAEDEAPSDSFVPPGTGTAAAAAVMDAIAGNAGTRKALASELLTIAGFTGRGQYATPAQRTRVDGIVAKLEELNPNPAPVETDLIDGEWVLLFGPQFFSSSPLIAFAAKPLLQIGQVRQTIAVDDGRIFNEVDLVAFPEVSLVVKTTGRLTPVGGQKLEVGVEKTTVTGGSIAERFDLGGLSFDVPVERIYQRLKGTSPETTIETSYLDESLRISRSKDGKLFVYARV